MAKKFDSYITTDYLFILYYLLFYYSQPGSVYAGYDLGFNGNQVVEIDFKKTDYRDNYNYKNT